MGQTVSASEAYIFYLLKRDQLQRLACHPVVVLQCESGSDLRSGDASAERNSKRLRRCGNSRQIAKI
jgi:hypothetical protein